MGEGKQNEYWYYDEKAKVLRNRANSAFVLGWDSSSSKPNVAVTQPVGEKSATDLLQDAAYIKENYQVVVRKACLGTIGGKNDEEGEAKFAACSKTDRSQSWYPWYRYQAPGPHWNRLQNE